MRPTAPTTRTAATTPTTRPWPRSCAGPTRTWATRTAAAVRRSTSNRSRPGPPTAPASCARTTMADKDSRYRFLRLYVMQDLGLESLSAIVVLAQDAGAVGGPGLDRFDVERRTAAAVQVAQVPLGQTTGVGGRQLQVDLLGALLAAAVQAQAVGVRHHLPPLARRRISARASSSV